MPELTSLLQAYWPTLAVALVGMLATWFKARGQARVALVLASVIRGVERYAEGAQRPNAHVKRMIDEQARRNGVQGHLDREVDRAGLKRGAATPGSEA